MYVDGTDMDIQELRSFEKKWLSQNLNGPALRYEVGLLW